MAPRFYRWHVEFHWKKKSRKQNFNGGRHNIPRRDHNDNSLGTLKFWKTSQENPLCSAYFQVDARSSCFRENVDKVRDSCKISDDFK